MENSKIPRFNSKPQIKSSLPILNPSKKISSIITSRTIKSSVDFQRSKTFLVPKIQNLQSIKHGRIARKKIVSPKVVKNNATKKVQSQTSIRNNYSEEDPVIALQMEHDDLQNKFDAISQKYSDMLGQIEQLKDSRQLLRSKVEECNEKDKQLNEIHVQLREAQGNHAKTFESLQELKHRYNTTVAQLEEVQSQLTTVQKTHKMLQNNYEKLKKENVDQTKLIEKNRLKIQQLIQQMVVTDIERRKLHNTIQTLKGNIRVFCRIRPQLEEEFAKKMMEINYIDQFTMEILNDSIKTVTGVNRTSKQEFLFDYIFTPESTQEEIFDELQQLIQSSLDGYNVCIFAYGQTGSGKTFTMDGTNEHLGMIPRSIDYIFQAIEERKGLNWSFKITASFLEIYNEQILDLLSNNIKNRSIHDIRMVNNKSSEVYVTNLHEENITSGIELKTLLAKAQRNRAVAATEMNERSSRSHAVCKIQIASKNSVSNEIWSSTLNLVDLAGSERPKSSEITRLNETKNINKSLSCLGNVILSLHQHKEHVPYRDSKLTHLLMSALGGNSKTLMIVNISPLNECINESVNSLRFASKVKECRVGNVKKNRIYEDCDS